MEEISFKVFTQGGVETLPLATLVVALLILASGTIFLGMWSRIDPSTLRFSPFPNSKVENLFLPVEIQSSGQPVKTHEGYLRSLTAKNATVVCSGLNFTKGDALALNLTAAGIRDVKLGLVSGKIVQGRSLGGLPESWLIDIKFDSQMGERFNQIYSCLK